MSGVRELLSFKRRAALLTENAREVAAWRDATFKIIHDPGRQVSRSTKRVEEGLHPSLKFYGYNESQRISHCSTTKSFLRALYSEVQVPVSLGRLIVNNGLDYQVLDTLENKWTENL